MELSFLMWLSTLLPPAQAEPLCLATTVYLEARDQSELGQRAVAEVALRRRDSGMWGDDVCAVVKAPKQFAPTLVPPRTRLNNVEAWEEAVAVAFAAQKAWNRPHAERRAVVPGASHFAAMRIANPSWASYPQVATIDDHTFFRVNRLRSREETSDAAGTAGGSR
jgi:spore germination cell wall hydrolase CwlJ-like protein